jgi:hypothetical protein
MGVMNTAPFVKLPNNSRQPSGGSEEERLHKIRTTLGLPLNSQHGIVLGKLFKLHPTFDEVLFSILLQSQPSPSSSTSTEPQPTWYLVFIAERNHHMNRLVSLRWKEKQREICCLNYWNPLQTSPCCEFLSYCELTFHRLERENILLTEEERELLTRRCQNYVLHRLRYIHYHSYTTALLSATVALDTFPYGGESIILSLPFLSLYMP